MASNINPNNINGAYPIAGQDNDSQGFRDNFTNIRTNLTFAASEITDLQTKVVLKAPLTGGTTVNNDMSGQTMSGAKTKGFTETYSDQLTGTTIDFANGDFQKFESIGSPLTFTFANWPSTATAVAKMKVWLTVDSVANAYVQLPATVTVGLNKIPNCSNTGNITVTGSATTSNYLLEFFTVDQGNTVLVVPLITP